MSSVYRTPAARAARCEAHPGYEATVACTRCGAALCDACAGYRSWRVACQACAERGRRLRALSRGCLAMVVSLGCVVATFALVTGPSAPRPPFTEGELRAIEAKAAVRACDEGATLLALLHDHAADDDRALVDVARAFEDSCGERPMVLAMAYRGACHAGDAPAASALAARLAALPSSSAPSWRGIACPARETSPPNPPLPSGEGGSDPDPAPPSPEGRGGPGG